MHKGDFFSGLMLGIGCILVVFSAYTFGNRVERQEQQEQAEEAVYFQDAAGEEHLLSFELPKRVEHLEQEQDAIKKALVVVGILEQTKGGGLRLRRAEQPLARAPEDGTKDLQSVDKRVDEPDNM